MEKLKNFIFNFNSAIWQRSAQTLRRVNTVEAKEANHQRQGEIDVVAVLLGHLPAGEGAVIRDF